MHVQYAIFKSDIPAMMYLLYGVFMYVMLVFLQILKAIVMVTDAITC
jgi:hypothetical protein